MATSYLEEFKEGRSSVHFQQCSPCGGFPVVSRVKDYGEIEDLLNLVFIHLPGVALEPFGKCHGFGLLIVVFYLIFSAILC